VKRRILAALCSVRYRRYGRRWTFNPTKFYVREGGVEPPHPFGHRNLNPARLPIPPLAHTAGLG
jgi:hypothetical protein